MEGRLNQLKKATNLQKGNLILGIIMLIYPGIKFILDYLLDVPGKMFFLHIVMAIGGIGFAIGIIQIDKPLKFGSKKTLQMLIILFIIEILLSTFRLIITY